jgi:hypothetical protein
MDIMAAAGAHPVHRWGLVLGPKQGGKMAMTLGGSEAAPVSEVDATLPIAVLLALLTIFTMMTPLVPRGSEAFVPHSQSMSPPKGLAGRPGVFTLNLQSWFKLNQGPATLSVLGWRLEGIFRVRNEGSASGLTVTWVSAISLRFPTLHSQGNRQNWADHEGD